MCLSITSIFTGSGKSSEVLDFGIEEYFNSASPCFMEWPELIEPLLPSETLKISVTVMPDGSRVIENRQ